MRNELWQVIENKPCLANNKQACQLSSILQVQNWYQVKGIYCMHTWDPELNLYHVLGSKDHAGFLV